MFIIDTIAQGLALARIGARATDDPDLLASLERLDSLTYHEAVNFLKLPYMGRRGKRK